MQLTQIDPAPPLSLKKAVLPTSLYNYIVLQDQVLQSKLLKLKHKNQSEKCHIQPAQMRGMRW